MIFTYLISCTVIVIFVDFYMFYSVYCNVWKRISAQVLCALYRIEFKIVVDGSFLFLEALQVEIFLALPIFPPTLHAVVGSQNEQVLIGAIILVTYFVFVGLTRLILPRISLFKENKGNKMIISRTQQ